MISLDTETTGVDFRHGTKPFLVTICEENGAQQWWEWEVDPTTREPQVPRRDLKEIQKRINGAEHLVLQNPKFDWMALQTVYHGELEWDWSKVYDTLLAGHLLASNQYHDLATMSLVYIGVNIKPFEDDIDEACAAARRIAKKEFPDWRVAQVGLPEMPSARGKVTKYDMWLPRAVARGQELPADDPWWTVCSEYANSDSAVTLPLFKAQKKELVRRRLWRIYTERLKILPIVCEIEDYGVTISKERLEELKDEYQEQSDLSGRICINVANGLGEELELPRAGVNNSLREFVTTMLENSATPVEIPKTPTDQISLSKSSLQDIKSKFSSRNKEFVFIDNLEKKRKRDTAIQYMHGYERFWKPMGKEDDWMVLHPSLNPTGTYTLRWSSSNPNEQNISKQEGFNLRYCFGPAPGREWWSLDAKNIELRIPAYEAGEEAMIDLFEREDEAPYYGSYHMLIFDLLHPDKFAKHGMKCKDEYASSWYQWTKNGNFAVQYGAVEASGTADRAYHVDGAQRLIQSKFGKVSQLNDKMIALATKQGYVETIPDRTVDPDRGYPLFCTRSQWGDIIPTVPLNYHVQGTAMWWMMKAMIRCHEYLATLSDCYVVMQVHDELVFDMPAGNGVDSWKTNMPKIRKIRRLMEEGGKDIGVSTPVGVEYHNKTWSEGHRIL